MKFRQFNEIMRLDPANYSTSSEYQAEVISIYKDVDIYEVYEMPFSDISSLYFNILKKIQTVHICKPVIQINGIDFFKKDFNKLTLGEYIDIEAFFSNVDTILEGIMILYRRRTQADELAEIVDEPYGDFLTVRKPYFNDVIVWDIIGVKNEFMKWRQNILEAYKGLFTSQEAEEEDDSQTAHLDTKSSKIETMKKQMAEDNSKKFAWESIIMSLCNDNITGFVDVLNQPFILVLNVLSAQKNKNN